MVSKKQKSSKKHTPKTSSPPKETKTEHENESIVTSKWIIDTIMNNTFQTTEDKFQTFNWIVNFISQEILSKKKPIRPEEVQQTVRKSITPMLTKKQLEEAEAKKGDHEFDWLVTYLTTRIIRSIKRSEQAHLLVVPPKTEYQLKPDQSCYDEPYDIRCLGYINVVCSSTIRNPYNLYPELQDPGLSILWDDEVPEIFIDEKLYTNLTKEYNTPVIRQVLEVLQEKSNTIDLKFYRLTEPAVRALTEALQKNNFIKKLDLTNTSLNETTAGYLGHLMKLNDTIEELVLKDCRMSPEVADRFSENFEGNKKLLELNLDGCYLGDEGFKSLAVFLESHGSLKKLNLAHNDLTWKSCGALADILMSSMTIESLILSWNSLNLEKELALIFDAINDNYVHPMVELNLEWNNVTGGAKELDPSKPNNPLWKLVYTMLRKHENIKKLNLNNNFLTGESIDYISQGITRAKGLQELRLSGNRFTNEDFQKLLTAMSHKKCPVNLLDLSHYYLPKEHKEVINRILETGKIVLFSGFLDDYIITGPDLQKMLLERMKGIVEPTIVKKKSGKKKQKVVLSFGSFFWDVPDGKVLDRDHFVELLKTEGFSKLTLDTDLIDSVVKAFKVGKTIDMTQMRDVFLKLNPDTPKPLPKVPKTPSKEKKPKKKK